MIKKLLPTLAITALCAACSPTIHHQSKHLDQAAIDNVRVGVHSKRDVAQLLGTPSTMATFDPNTWYYVSKVTSTTAFFHPDVASQDAYVVKFDRNGIVQDVAHKTFDDAEDPDHVDRITPTSGQKMSFLEQMFGNFGRITRQRDNLENK
ncbi:MAG: outer membrane protein assembly factor BamE [Alphaproteobacteria bacterium]